MMSLFWLAMNDVVKPSYLHTNYSMEMNVRVGEVD